MWNVLHSWRKFCSKFDVHRLLFKHIPLSIPRIYDVVNCQLALVAAWAGLYIDVDLNAKYAVMCRKTVLIPENDENRHIRVFGNTFTYNSDIFSGTSEAVIYRPLNICNHSSLFKFVHNFVNCLCSWTIM